MNISHFFVPLQYQRKIHFGFHDIFMAEEQLLIAVSNINKVLLSSDSPQD
jgi:hypothetical protein